MKTHKEHLNNLLEQFSVNCHRTLEDFLKDPHPQMTANSVSEKNAWLARFVIAYEGEQWSRSGVPGINLDYARFCGWMNGR